MGLLCCNGILVHLGVSERGTQRVFELEVSIGYVFTCVCHISVVVTSSMASCQVGGYLSMWPLWSPLIGAKVIL